ncbi:MAG: hypothetical protein BMS9Abin02_1096 [Anaerolineae bacterium]|nr:MAG: hypothetical protein BMS9Abin02_1096 [Anaerolineae bacterium]
MDAEEILEGLSQEERLKLLERLIQGAEQAQEESLSVEDRVERLESLVGLGPTRRRGHRGHRGPRMFVCHCGCG